MSSTLSDTVEIVTFDKKHQLARQQIFDQHSEGGREHLKAGFKSLWHGVFGAVTSIPLQTYTEMQEKGPLVCFLLVVSSVSSFLLSKHLG